jgi:hypothetical protein
VSTVTISVKREEDPERIPQSWVDHGRCERAPGAQLNAFAIRAAPILVEREPSYRVPGNGTVPGDYRFDQNLEVLYVARDTEHALVDHVDAHHKDDEVRPTDSFYAVRSVQPQEFDGVESVHSRDLYGCDLQALYGDVVDRDLDWPAHDAEFETARTLRADGGDRR